MNKKQLQKCYHNALVYVTKRCNLWCPRCFLGELPAEKRKRDMTWDEYLTILRRLQEQNIKLNYIHFTGGEPTLWPHLKPAIEKARDIGIAKTIRVVTNAVDRNVEDYGQTDVIYISHYGAINRQDILRLKKQCPKRVKIQYVVHLSWPFPENSPDAIPADCGSVFLAFLADRVYPCGIAAAKENDNWISVEEPFYETFINADPQTQQLCKTCISNRKNKKLYMPSLTAEFGVWDSSVCSLFGLNGKAFWLRKIYNRIKGMK